MERNVKLISSNETLGTMKYVGGAFATEREAEAWARGWFGDPARKRSFACILLEVGRERREIVRGMSDQFERAQAIADHRTGGGVA